jgi:hypothetical protein
MTVSGFLKKYGKETYKYTEEDLIKAFKAGHSGAFVKEHTVSHYKEYIQSQQQKRPKYFECEIVTVEPYKDKMGNIRSEKTFPKTITNSKGQTELVGSYTY